MPMAAGLIAPVWCRGDPNGSIGDTAEELDVPTDFERIDSAAAGEVRMA